MPDGPDAPDSEVPDRGGPGGGAEPGSDGPGGDENAQAVWRLGEDLEQPVTVVVDGEEYEAGAGPPEGRVELTPDQLRAAADAADHQP